MADDVLLRGESVVHTPLIGQYASDVHSKLWLVSAGSGLAPTTRTIAEVKRPGLVFRQLPPGLPMVKTLLVWKRANTAPVLRQFLECFASGSPPHS